MSYGGYGYGGGDGDGYGNNQGYNNQGGYNNGGGFGGPPPGPPPGQYGGYDDGNQGGYGQRDFGGPPPGPPPGQYDNSRWGGDGNENGDGGYEGRRAHGGYEGQQGGYGGRQNEYEAQGGYGGNSSGGYGNSGRHGGGGYENEGGRQNRYEGQSSQGGYGQSSQGGYGQSSQGGYGQSSQGGYGQSSQGGYGQSSQGGYGQSSQGGYGQSSQGGYDQGSQGGYGQSSGGQSSGARYGNPNYGGSHSTQNQRFNAPPSHGQSFGVEGVQNYKYSQCTGRRKALLIGINYIGQKAQLKGCINDVKNVRKFLIEVYGYKEDDMVVLTDDQQNQQSIPTKANILRACQWLVKDAQPNDSLFLHYSGHGGQESDSNGDENDGFDECIYPVDYASAGSIVDDVLHRALVSPLPAGARLTSLMDCCHSATVLDLPYVYSTKGVLKEPSMLKDAGKGVLSALSSYTSGDIQGVMSSVSSSISRLQKGNKGYEYTIKNKTSPADVVMISGCKDNQTSADSFEDGAATGAMSHAFIQVMRNNKNQSYLSLLNNMRDVLEDKYEQKPQLSCSHPLDCDLQFIM